MIAAKTVANLFGATFILVGFLGFVPNPIVAPDGLFVVNAMHNFVHILTGVAFLAGAQLGYARETTLGIGAYYVAVTILGFLTKGDMLLGLIHINAADRWLHAGLAAVILAAGFIASSNSKITSDRATAE